MPRKQTKSVSTDNSVVGQVLELTGLEHDHTEKVKQDLQGMMGDQFLKDGKAVQDLTIDELRSVLLSYLEWVDSEMRSE